MPALSLYRIGLPSLLATPGPLVSALAPSLCQRRCFARKHYVVKRVEYPWKKEILAESWKFLHAEMVAFFRNKPARDSTAYLYASSWPKFLNKERLLDEGFVPAVVTGYGVDRKLIIKKADILPFAFDEEGGHVSHLFKGRLFKLVVDQEEVECCLVSDYRAHSVNKALYFVRFHRHVPGKITEVSVPVSLVGLFGCPGQLRGASIDLAMPTVDLEVVGEDVPPPFLVDCSKLDLVLPYGKITLEDLKPLLPKDGKTRFHRKYGSDLSAVEVVWCYDHKKIPEVPLPADYVDPNFINQRGNKMHVTYSGFFPKQ